MVFNINLHYNMSLGLTFDQKEFIQLIEYQNMLDNAITSGELVPQPPISSTFNRYKEYVKYRENIREIIKQDYITHSSHKFSLEQDTDCCICFEIKQPNQFGQLNCNHIFCISCIQIHRRCNTKCPICRQNITHVFCSK